jgi:hypothetical protein
LPDQIRVNCPSNPAFHDRALTQPCGFFFYICGALQAIDSVFQDNAFGRDRRNRRDKSGGPSLFETSLKVKRNFAHSQAPRSLPPGLKGVNALGPLKGPLQMELSLRKNHRKRPPTEADLLDFPLTFGGPIRCVHF